MDLCFDYTAKPELQKETLLVTDVSNHRIRRVDLVSKTVSTYLGNGEKMSKDGFASTCSLESPRLITSDLFGNLAISDDSGIRYFHTKSGTRVETLSSTSTTDIGLIILLFYVDMSQVT